MKCFVGWDVGGWNCDQNRNSRDALAILTVDGRSPRLEGEVDRGNIREEINRFDHLWQIVNELCGRHAAEAIGHGGGIM